MSNLYLEHHGILGMKWGIRRFQNKDGSYTNAGRKRYGIEREKNKYKTVSKENSIRALSFNSDYADSIAKAKKQGKWNLVGSLQNLEHDEIEAYFKKVYSQPDIQKQIKEARNLLNQVDKIADETISNKSPLAQKAYKEFLKNNNSSDPEYEFWHYRWRSGSGKGDYGCKEYDEAYKKYKEDPRRKQYDQMVTSIGKSIVGEYANVKAPNKSAFDNYFGVNANTYLDRINEYTSTLIVYEDFFKYSDDNSVENRWREIRKGD